MCTAEHGFYDSAKQHGSVMVEFVLVVPLLLVILGYSLRLTQILQANQIAMVMSREAATEAFKLCTDLTVQMRSCSSSSSACVNPQMTKTVTENCLQNVKKKYEDLWPVTRPSANPSNRAATIDIEVYRYDITNLVNQNTCQPDETKVSRFTTITAQSPAGITASSLCLRNRVSRAKISFIIKPTSAFLNLTGGFADSDITIMDETVL
jgi:Flp pilus assembly protein TadG